MRRDRQAGFTLAEQALSLLVLALVVGAIATVVGYAESHSTDPMLERQGLALAEAYLEEVLAKSYFDPDDGETCPPPESDRDAYDNLCDFAGLVIAGAVFPDGSLTPGLDDFQIQIDVIADGSAALGPLTGAHNGGAAPATIRVDVTVLWQERVNLVLTGYRSAPPV